MCQLDSASLVRVAAATAAVAVGLPAMAETPSCVALAEPGFRELVDASHRAIDAESVEDHRRAVRELESRIPCLDWVPDPDLWAEFLFGLAVVAYFAGEDWEAPLSTALYIAPGNDRGVGPDHEIAHWVPPPPPPPTGRVVPDGVRLYVDGELVSHVPAAAGLHLVQVRDGDGLRSALLRNAPVPEEWLREPRVAEERSRSRDLVSIRVGAVGGGGWFVQTVDDPGADAGDESKIGFEGGAAASTFLGRPVGIVVDARATSASRLEGRAGLAVAIGPVVPLVAVGITTTEHIEASTAVRDFGLLPEAGVRIAAGRRWTVDGGLLGGMTPAIALGQAELGLTTPGEGLRWRAGLDGRWMRTVFVQDGSDRELVATDIAVFGNLGFAWGAW